MSDGDLFLDQYIRVLDGLPADDPWPALHESGFLDLLRPEADGGAGLELDAVFALAVETGRRPHAPAVIETMAARLIDPQAIAVADIEPLHGRPLAAALAAAHMVGAMEAIEELTLAYALQRRQFGREIGRFQAVQNLVAVLVEEVRAARMAVQAGLVGPLAAISPRTAALAKIRAGQAAVTVAASAHAVHGAIGISEEYALHHHVRRLRAWRIAHGGENWWSHELGEWAISVDRDVTTLARGLTP
ncbi:MAG: acyl-CoA dehydrogenase family protein [Novosphingobium sp.]|nr:acyl-CoA dehydrogenase family protein [Novosphingobium sp.]